MASEDVRALGHERSGKWPEVEKAHLAKEGWCRNCGGTAKLQVHHVAPFHLHPELELQDSNLITLCEDVKDGVECHLHIGHLGNWKNFNPQVRFVANSVGPGVPARHIVEAASAPVAQLTSTTNTPPAP